MGTVRFSSTQFQNLWDREEEEKTCVISSAVLKVSPLLPLSVSSDDSAYVIRACVCGCVCNVHVWNTSNALLS